MEENIALIPYTNDYIIPENGKYLVRTETLNKTVHYFSIYCEIKNSKTSMSISNQIVTHISKEKLKDKEVKTSIISLQSIKEKIDNSLNKINKIIKKAYDNK